MHCDHVTVARKMLVGSEDLFNPGDGMEFGNLKGGNNTGCFHLDPGLVRGVYISIVCRHSSDTQTPTPRPPSRNETK